MGGLESKEDYLRMLNELYSKLPVREERKTTRLEIPSPEVVFEGRRTIILNFKRITSVLNRDPKLMSSYFAKELATPVVFDDPRLILQSRVDRDSLASALTRFVKKYVVCPACSGIDTKLTKKRRLLVLKCEVCGAETVVEPI